MADFVRYVNGPADSEWGKQRAADGHPEPYRLKHLELGNEEKIDAAYWSEVPADGRGDLGGRPDDHRGRRRLPLQAGDHRPLSDPGERGRRLARRPQADPRTRPRAGPRGLVRHPHQHRPPARAERPPARAELHRAARQARPGGEFQGGHLRIQLGQPRPETGPEQRPGPPRRRAARPGRAGRLRGELPPARRAERQRVGSGAAVPQPEPGLAPAAGLPDAADPPPLPAEPGPERGLGAGRDVRASPPSGATTGGRWSSRSSTPATTPEPARLELGQLPGDQPGGAASSSWPAPSKRGTPPPSRPGSSLL